MPGRKFLQDLTLFSYRASEAGKGKQLMKGVVSNQRSLWATRNPAAGELAAAWTLHLSHPTREAGEPLMGCSLLHINSYTPLACLPSQAPAARGAPQAEMPIEADRGPDLATLRPHWVWAPLTCLLHLLPFIPCILLWGVSFAGIFYALGMHVPSV